MRQYIYFAQTENAIKIGMTKDLKQRLTELQCGCPTLIRYIYTTLVRYNMKEEKLHDKFYEYRLRGEWYQAQPILKYLDTIPTYIRLNKITSEEQMNVAWKAKMKGEVERSIIKHSHASKQ